MLSYTSPIAKKIPYSYNIHGQSINDDFAWMRSLDWPNIQNPDILDYISLENKYSDQFFQQHQNTINKLYKELKDRIQLSDQSPYTKKKQYFYYTRTEEDKSYPIFCRKYGSIESPEEILLDVNLIAVDHPYVSIGSFSISPDNSKVAYSIDYNGEERYEINILDIKNNITVQDRIHNTIGKIIWHESLDGFFYILTNELWRSDKVFFHLLGSTTEDQLIFWEQDSTYNIELIKSSDSQYIFIKTSSFDNNEVHFISLNNQLITPKIIHPRTSKLVYEVEHHKGSFFILTNNSTENFKLTFTDINNTSKKYWQDFISPKEDEYLESFCISNNFIVLNYKILGLAKIQILNLNNKEIHTLNFQEKSFIAVGYISNYEENDIRIKYSSLSQPEIIYQYNIDSKQLVVLKSNKLPLDFCKEDYIVERVYANNNDVNVPISLIYKKSLFKKDGSNPLYLYGYGSYGISISPSFNSHILSLVNRGFIFAIAHTRGGSDLGYNWYQDAKFLSKKNTFDDFIACTQFLIKHEYTKKGNIIIEGGSAGGLLVGAVINSHPELYKAAIAHVPFVDVLNTMLDDTLPLTPGEFQEWGNPILNPEFFEYIKSYSPYDNVIEKSYPHLYVTASTTDPRVGYWEPLKWIAKLRSKKIDNNVLILRVNTESGHSGPTNRFHAIKEKALDYSFILSCFNLC